MILSIDSLSDAATIEEVRDFIDLAIHAGYKYIQFSGDDGLRYKMEALKHKPEGMRETSEKLQ